MRIMRIQTNVVNLFFLSSTIGVTAFVPDDICAHKARSCTGTPMSFQQGKEDGKERDNRLSLHSKSTHYCSRLQMVKEDRGTRVIAKAPILKNWSKNTDGSLTANIFNSPDFRNNEKITTSRILDKNLKSGQLVTSISGSKYRLEGNVLPSGKTVDAIEKKGTFSIGNQARLAKGTFSIKNAKFGPKGIPTLRKWKQNSDGSISGRIFGSKSFKDNEFVTTSPISGAPGANSFAKTISGSRYYLEGNGILPTNLNNKKTGTRSLRDESRDTNKGIGSVSMQLKILSLCLYVINIFFANYGDFNQFL
jgi:hypothetical protein